MAFTTAALAIVGTVAAGAETGYEAKRGHDQKVQAQHKASDNLAAQNAAEREQAQREKMEKERTAQQIQLRRQIALGSTETGRSGTIRTSPFGAGGIAPRVGGNSFLGAA